ncbi:hypothetical protein ONZ51_g12869 [Trametes cubensis]|uniref:Lytic polysaccharide monooxygenase n=1 Tax=Trametes cubensis TaxID=1111947 RepID=A0AAD7TF17_9APHY|nr:hypothetical protein ONZ51_g12869 [Trametes cubensis]
MLAALPASLAVAAAAFASTASAHIAFWSPAMYGFNVTDQTFSYDNRPQVPLYNMTFDQWWFHGHIGYPPNPGDFYELKAGGEVDAILSCDKGATVYYNSSQGRVSGDVGYGSNSPCPGAPMSEYHTTGFDDLKGCALAIAYKSDVNDVQPDDFVIFSVNQTCVWEMHTKFQVPNLPACPEEGCHCAWFWIHSIDSGSEQIYMNGFKCKVTGDVGTQPLGKPAVPRRCGADPDNGRPDPTPGNCTIGAKLPMYWYQREGNNMFEDTYHAPYYDDLYGFHDGAQTDIFQDGVIASLAGSGAGSGPTSTPVASSATAVTSAAQTTPTQAPPASSSPNAPASSVTPSSSATISSSTAVSSTFTHPDTTFISSTPVPTSIATSADISVSISASIDIGAVVGSSISTSSAPAETRKCKPRPAGSAPAVNKRKHARHLSGLRHSL